ncbi:MAG: hypothetical protein AAF679_14470, partial [Pseudomonadota bacterium]
TSLAATSGLPNALQKAMADADVTLFLARLGDQLRFSEMPQGAVVLNSYTLNPTLLTSAFSTARIEAFVALKEEVDQALCAADEIEITCPEGTNVRGVAKSTHPQAQTSLKRFPLSVFSPVSAATFSGRVALCGFLTGTGSRYYDDYTTWFQGKVLAHFTHGRLEGFEGTPGDVARAEAQYDRVSDLFGIDRNAVHSWHAGLHPGCGFAWDVRVATELWGGAAFGNPRILHFHTCGAYAPGEISWNVVDPSILVDGLPVWERGRFHPERLSKGAVILAEYPCARAAFDHPDRRIGW